MKDIFRKHLYNQIISGHQYTIDEIVDIILEFKNQGYTHIEISGSEYDLETSVFRPKTEEEKEADQKRLDDYKERQREQRLENYKKLREEFGALPHEEI